MDNLNVFISDKTLDILSFLISVCIDIANKSSYYPQQELVQQQNEI